MRSKLNAAVGAVAAVVALILVAAFLPSAGAYSPTSPAFEAKRVSCNLNSSGRCTIQHGLGVVPAAVVVSADTPNGFNGFMLNTDRDSYTTTAFVVRAMYNQTTPKSAGTIWFTYVAYMPETAPPPTTVPPTTTTTTVPTTTPPVTTTTPRPAPSGFPTPATTGVPAGTTFSTTVAGNHSVHTDGAVLDGWHVTGVLEIYAQNVVIRNSKVDLGIENWRDPTSSYTVSDSTLGPDSGCRYQAALHGHNFSATRVHIRNMVNGVSMTDDGSQPVIANASLVDSFAWICSPPNDDSHSDGFETCCEIAVTVYDHITIRHNTIDIRLSHAASATAAVDLAEARHQHHVTVTDNLIMGGAYTMYAEAYTPDSPSTPKWTITNNKWVQGEWAFGPLTTDGTCGNINWGPGNERVTIDANYQVTSVVGPVSCA